MLDTISSRQLSEWLAFDHYSGAVSTEWRDEMSAEIHELVQVNNILTGASVTPKGGKNPAGEFRRPARPWELFDPPEEGGDDVEE